MDEGTWKKGDRVVVSNDPERGPGAIDGEVLVVSAGEHHVRFWPVLFDDLSEEMIEEKRLARAPARASRRRFRVGEVVRTSGALSGNIREVSEEDGQVRYRIEAWISEAELEQV